MKITAKSIILIFTVSFLLIISACHKEGNGGKASLEGLVKHHSAIIPNCEVYIKYGATEMPSTDVTHYDDHVSADASGHYEIKDLYKGDYYVYGVGYDASIMSIVTGGIAVKIKKNKSINLDVPVTE